MMRWLLWSLAGLLIGLVVHFATVIAMPQLSAETGFQRAATAAATSGFTVLTADKTPLPLPDPAAMTAFCRYNLDRGPLHLRVPANAGFLSISFYTPAGLNYYALTDRAAANGVIDLNLYSAAQLARIRANEGPDQPGALRLQAPLQRGMVVLRALIPEPGVKADVEQGLKAALCEQSEAPGAD